MDVSVLREKANLYVELETYSEFKDEVKKLLDNEEWDELNDRFYSELEFGTGGMRGVIGGGFMRMNPLMVRRATQGLANYIKNNVSGEASVVIAFDSRNYSDVFSREAALVLCGNGIKTYIFTSLRPTPELSFAVRHLGATAGIVVTASHNPPAYNGYKVFWSDGSQVVSPQDKGIIEEVRKVTSDIVSVSEDEAKEKGLLVYIDKEVDDAYFAAVERQITRPDVLKEHARELSVVYTPLHGAGRVPVETVLKKYGVDVFTVPEQREPDGNFPTVDYPNPEEASAMALALKYGKERKADVVMGTDPDSDRLGIAVPDASGEYVLVTGNQLGVLINDYVLSARKELGKLPPNPAVIKTVVTTNMQRKVAEYYGAACFDVLTGFKNIAAKIREFEKDNSYTYICGGEESYGYLIGSDVRDKDAVSAAVVTVEMTLYYRMQGKSLLDRLNELYRIHGYYEELLITKTFPGESGMKKMKEIMESMRNNPPSEFAGAKVVKIKDYLDGTTLDVASGKKEKDIDLPSSNVLQFIMDDESVVSARPSGTEPKIKFYASCTEKAEDDLDEAKKVVRAKLDKIREKINSLIP